MTQALAAAYPLRWEADVVLTDGGIGRLRPIRPDDADALLALHHRLSPRSVYYRYFGPKRTISEPDLRHLVEVDHDRRVALVVWVGDELVGVGRYEAAVDAAGPDAHAAEVAFVVDDAHHGRGIASILLEHLAAAARDRGIGRFEAEVLAGNRGMLRVFLDAGYHVQRSHESGSVLLAFPVAQTDQSREVMRAREQRADSRSVHRLLHSTSVAVIGASRDPTSVGGIVLRTLLAAGLPGPVSPVNPVVGPGGALASVAAYASIRDVPGSVELAVVCTPATALADVVDECAAKGVHGLVVMTDVPDPERRAELVARVRRHGMRLIGPAALGLVVPSAGLNASLVRHPPPPGPVGFFTESGALGIPLLEALAGRGLGISSFLSVGRRADVSGNDLLQYYMDDVTTGLVLLYFETFGNPRKFARVTRRLSRAKPVVAVLAATGAVENALLAQAGVIRVANLEEMLDVSTLLVDQPLPRGDRTAVVANSDALCRITAQACEAVGLTPEPVLALPVDAGPDEYEPALTDAARQADALVAVFVPPADAGTERAGAVAAAVGAKTGIPVVTTLLGATGAAAGLGRAPCYRTPEAAVAALGRARAYARWRSRPHGAVPALTDCDPAAARAVLADCPAEGRLDREQVSALLAAYGIPLVPAEPVADEDAALVAAARIGWPVVLRSRAEGPDRTPVRPDAGLASAAGLGATNPAELRESWRLMTREEGRADGLVVPQTPSGVPLVISASEDPRFGPLVSFAVAGLPRDLLGDIAWRILPMTDVDAAEAVRSVRLAPLLFDANGTPRVDVAALETLLLRVARLKDDLARVAAVELRPVVAASSGVFVLEATVELGTQATRLDEGPRRLR